MNNHPYEVLLQEYYEAIETIEELQEQLERKDWCIDLLKTNIEELEEILYETGLFKHYNFNQE
jgi:hypothetical protein